MRLSTRNPQLIRLLLSPQGEGGDATPSVPETPEAKAPTAEQAQKLIHKYGSDVNAVMQLMQENFKHRSKVDELEAQLPAPGSLVLTADQAREWEGYRSVGTVSDVRKYRTDSETFAQKTLREEQDARLIAAADAAGIPESHRKIFLKLADRDAEYIVKEEKGKDGEVSRKVFVKKGDAEQPFEEHHRDELPALAPEAREASKERPRGTPIRPSSGGSAERRVPSTSQEATKVEAAPKRLSYF